MGFNIISAAEAASYIKHGYNIGLSGFTPAGTPKAVTPEVAKIAEEEHAKGNPFQISIFTGASTGDATMEHAGGRIVQKLFETFPDIEEVELRLSKRNPPMGADIDAAGIELYCSRK